MKKVIICLGTVLFVLSAFIQISYANDFETYALIETESQNTRQYFDRTGGDHYYGYIVYTSVVSHNTSTGSYNYKNSGTEAHPYNNTKLSASFKNAGYFGGNFKVIFTYNCNGAKGDYSHTYY